MLRFKQILTGRNGILLGLTEATGEVYTYSEPTPLNAGGWTKLNMGFYVEAPDNK
jgi:hypothetical protein